MQDEKNGPTTRTTTIQNKPRNICSPSERRRIQIRPINNNIPSLLIQQRQPFLLPLSILLAYPPLLFLLSFFLLGFLGCFEDGAAFAADVV